MTRTCSLALSVAALSLLSAPQAAEAQPRCDAPRVLLSVDKSSSMLGMLPSGHTKWAAARNAIEALTDRYAETVDFGLQVFPYPDRCAPGRVTIDVGPNDSATLLGGLGTPPPSGGNYTPMAQTLDEILDYAPMLDGTRDTHVILITDGWQWCSPYDPATRFTPAAAVARLRAAGITVHVIGFGAAVDSLTLNRAAVAAGTELPGCDATLTDPAAMNHCYQQANDLGDLRAALDSIGRLITEEICDGWDNDCDGLVDEGFDVDGDGYTTCGTDPSTPGGTDPGRVDCDDAEAAVHPGATEICDGLDNDCDGVVDPGCSCTEGESRVCGSSIGACMLGTQTCTGGTWGACADEVAPAAETCDGLDNDCDGFVDDDVDCGPGRGCVDGRCTDLEEPPADPTPTPTPEDEPFAGEGPDMEGGCGCVAAGAGPDAGGAPLAALLGLGLVGLALTRLRRRR